MPNDRATGESISLQDIYPASRRSSTLIQEFAQPKHEEQSVSLMTSKKQKVKEKDVDLPKSMLNNRLFEGSWIAEILALCVATLATLIIIIILAMFKDKPLTQWHSRVTINALVNFVSQAAQTALLLPVASSISQMKWIYFQRKREPLGDMEDFDKASRQIFDNLLLVFKLPKKILIYLAALNAVLILLYGPFVQQSVALPIRNDKLLGHGGSIPVAVSYGTAMTLQAFGPPGTPMNYWSYTSVGSKMKQAIIAGILQDPQPSPSDVKALCTTGNCTFDPYSSLGACSSIEDVTSTIVDDCTEDKSCNYTVKALEAEAPWYDEIMISDFVLWMGSPGSSASIDNETRKLTYHIANSSLSEFYLLFYKDLSMRDKEHLVAFKGTLSLCVHTYNTSVLNGVTNTTVIDTQTNLTWSDTHANQQGDVLEYAVATGPGGQQFKVDPGSRQSIHEYMSKEIFTGEMLLGGPEFPNSTSGTAAGSVARAVYGDIDRGTVYEDRGVVVIDRRKRDVFPAGDELVTGGMKRVGELLEGLAMHMSNA